MKFIGNSLTIPDMQLSLLAVLLDTARSPGFSGLENCHGCAWEPENLTGGLWWGCFSLNRYVRYVRIYVGFQAFGARYVFQIFGR